MKYRILIVDDSDFSRNSIASMLDDPRFNIIGEAASAKEALAILQEREAHIVITDIVMPEVSGFELTESIAENFPRVFTIMISSLAQENVVIDAITAGACDFLQKPFSQSDLLNSIEKIISNIQQDS